MPDCIDPYKLTVRHSRPLLSSSDHLPWAMTVPTPTVLWQVLRARRHVYLLLFGFAIFSLFTLHGPRISLSRLSLGHSSQDAKIAMVQNSAEGM